MCENTPWYSWKNRNDLPNKRQPAVYFLALSEPDISGTEFNMIKEIIYIGMSVSQKGVTGRLNQFERAMKGADGTHGGAERVRFKHIPNDHFFDRLYVSICSFPISASRNTSDDLRSMGECVKHEYVNIADYLDRHGILPEFNDPKRSKKKI